MTVLRDEALPPVEAIPQGADGYDFDARYTPGRDRVRGAGRDRPGAGRGGAAACRASAAAASRASTCSLPPTGRRWILELNIVPGLTETSTAPLAAQAAGMTFEELVAALLQSAQIAPR